MKARATIEGDNWRAPLSQPMPAIILAVGVGLLVCSVANALSRATLAPSPLIYWAGLLLVGMPIFYRLTSGRPRSRERLALVCLLGLCPLRDQGDRATRRSSPSPTS